MPRNLDLASLDLEAIAEVMKLRAALRTALEVANRIEPLADQRGCYGHIHNALLDIPGEADALEQWGDCNEWPEHTIVDERYNRLLGEALDARCSA